MAHSVNVISSIRSILFIPSISPPVVSSIDATAITDDPQLMTESDWKLYNARILTWRDRYVERLTRELIIALADVTAEAIDRFWNTHEEITTEARLLRQCFDGSSRETMIHHLVAMLGAGIITDKDLEGFSDQVRNVLIGGSDVPYEEPVEFSEDDEEYDVDDE